ncbi:MAG: hypothetical protein IIC06_04200 [Proteobacteria bacterium]|nr:hypothetical protein [Pseudomonadota bacterium]
MWARGLAASFFIQGGKTRSMSKLLIIFGLVLLMTVPVSFAQAQQAFEGSGSAVISDSLTLSDKITYSLTGVTRLAPDQSYEGWLVNSGTGALQSTGLMTVDGSSKISHSWVSPDGDNLIEDYDTVVISVEPVPDSDPGSPSSIKPFSASISPGAMMHIRHLLVSWPEGDDAGILTNLNIQLDVAIQHVDLARNSATLDDVLLHTQHIINVVDGDGFPTESGRAKLVPARVTPPDELPDDDYPLVLSTGRMLEHWHTGSMTRRSGTLDKLESVAVASLHPDQMKALGLAPGDTIRVASRRGAIEIAARADRDVPDGMVFIPFCFHEAAANLLTNPKLDPFGKIPEFKFCAVSVEGMDAPADAAE